MGETDRAQDLVFISYSTKDREIAEAARDHLERRGMRAWMAPRDIRPGEQYAEAIIEAIDSSRVLVLVLSRHSDASAAVACEVERAFSKGTFIIPLVIEKFQVGKRLEFFLATRQRLEVFGMRRGKQLALLAAGVEAAISPNASGAMVPPAGSAPEEAGQVTESLPSGVRGVIRRLPRAIQLAGAGLMVVVLIGIVAYLGRDNIDLVRRAQAYEAIQQGKGMEAQAQLDTLEREGSSGDRAFATAGKAAVRLLQGDAGEVPSLIAKAREITRECSLCDVVEADLLLLEGKVETSRALYRTALERRSAAPFERAAAAAGMGRSFSSEGKGEEALRFYTQALENAPGNSRALAGRARVLAGMGKYEEAITGIRGHAADAYVGQVLRTLTRELELRRRGEQQDRISRLVDDLVKQYQEHPRSGVPEDTWTSRPTALCFFETSVQGGPSYQEGEDGVLVAGVQDALLDNGRFSVVEREDVDRVLQELKLAASGAADQESAIRFGRLRTAGILLYTTATRQGGRTALSFKAVSTETSEILGRVTAEALATGQTEIFRVTAGKLLALLARAMPIRGKVTGTASGGVELNIGERVGVKEGMVFNLFAPNDTSHAVGTLRVVQTSDSSSRAEVVQATSAPRGGDRVEIAL